MLTKKIETKLNTQVALEQESSLFYLALASWAEVQGYHGITRFLYFQSDKKRNRMIKLFQYINEKGGPARVPVVTRLPDAIHSVLDIFEEVLKHEILVSTAVNKLFGESQDAKDINTQNFLQWLVSVQRQEVKYARILLNKLSLIGNDSGGMYLFDRDLDGVPADHVKQAKIPLQQVEANETGR